MQLAERLKRERKEWFGNPIGDLCGSLVTTFALIPEVIGFMIVVGLPPYMGLFTCIPNHYYFLFRRMSGSCFSRGRLYSTGT